MTAWIEREKDWLSGSKGQKKKPSPNISVKVLTTVVFYVLRCPDPQCRSRDIFTYKSDPPIRYHKCRNCGASFKSVEKEAPYLQKA